jgi:uncharacterized Zn-finger protein
MSATYPSAGSAAKVAAPRTVAIIRRLSYESVAMPVEVPEIIEVETTKVACDGGGGALGHPKIYLEMGDEDFVECPYCDRRFVLKAGAEAH